MRAYVQDAQQTVAGSPASTRIACAARARSGTAPRPQASSDLLKKLQERQREWALLSPPIGLRPGERGQRTGHYRVGQGQPLMNGDQPGSISATDLAVVDEL